MYAWYLKNDFIPQFLQNKGGGDHFEINPPIHKKFKEKNQMYAY